MTEIERPAQSDTRAAVTLRVAIARIYRALRLRSPTEITPSQVSVLFRIEQSQPVRMGVLANFERVTPATLSKVVDSLEALHLVEREPDPLDGRVTLLRVSVQGRELIAVQRAASTRAIEEALAQLSVEDRAALLLAMPALEALSDVMLEGRDD